MTLRLKVGEKHVEHLQQYETLAVLLSQAFGGGSSSKTTTVSTANQPQTQGDAQRMFRNLFS
jgi:hypothetical protein